MCLSITISINVYSNANVYYDRISARKCMTARGASNQSSRAWINRQLKDPYVQKAQDLALPSRAYFKLEEINETLFYSAISKKGKNKSSYRRLIQPNMTVLDLGAAPGGWSIYASSKLDSISGGSILSVDLLPLISDISSRIHTSINGRFKFIQGDFSHNEIRDEIKMALGNLSRGTTCNSIEQQKANLIISDMAANFTGDSLTDAIRTINLCEQSLEFAAGGNCFDASYSPIQEDGMLTKNGSFLCKYFSCGKENEKDLMDAAKRVFKSIYLLKPNSSRKESSEMYLLGYNKR